MSLSLKTYSPLVHVAHAFFFEQPLILKGETSFLWNMEDTCGGSLCFEDLQLGQSSSSLQCDDNNENIFFREIKGEKFAVKKLALNCDGIINHEEQHWEKLIKLRDSHIVCYRHCFIDQDFR